VLGAAQPEARRRGRRLRPEGSKTEVSGTSRLVGDGDQARNARLHHPRSICDTALGEMPSRRARSRADMPRATRRAQPLTDPVTRALGTVGIELRRIDGGGAAHAAIVSGADAERAAPDRASRVRHM
jgi:hypothetical protein